MDQRIDTRELKVPGYKKRLHSSQPPTKYGLFVYRKEVIHLTKGTKRRKAITQSNYKRENRKSYKNLEWLDRMYERRKKDSLEDLYKVILPLELPVGYKLYDHNEEYYATVLAEDEIFYYFAIKKDNDEPHYFLKTLVEKMYVQAQCGGPYGFKVPLEFVEGYERP